MSFKFIKINAPLSHYRVKFNDPVYEKMTYHEIKDIIEWDAVYSAGSWAYHLNQIGYEAKEIYGTVKPLQLKWANEKGISVNKQNWKLQIIIEQLKEFKPEVIFSSDWDTDLIKAIRENVPSVRVCIGALGSYIPPLKGLDEYDCIIDPAPEAVEKLREMGLNAVHLNKAVDKRWLDRINSNSQQYDITFAGSLLLTEGCHRNRIEMLGAIIKQNSNQNIGIFTDRNDILKHITKFSGTSLTSRVSRKIKTLIDINPFLKILGLTYNETINYKSLNRILKYNFGPVYGISMLEMLQSSKTTLNVHASSSPTHASNFRLFEATLAGTCLLTDWKDNLPDLFEPDSEIVTYRSAEEAAEKIQYLLKTENKRKAIAEAGQKRTLRDHTLDVRVKEMDTIIRNLM